MAHPTSKRIRTLSICRPIIYGNTAVPFGDVRPAEADPLHSHHWTVFVRGPQGEDISYFIKKVVFKLHDTYNNPTRTIEEPPFEVTETGWGEFEIGIKIFFISEANEKNINLYHHLKLHPYPGLKPSDVVTGSNDEDTGQDENGVVSSIQYDEIVFNEPTEQLFQIMTKKPGNILPKTKNESIFSKETEAEEIQRFDNGIKTVNLEIEKLRKQIIEHQQLKAQN